MSNNYCNLKIAINKARVLNMWQIDVLCKMDGLRLSEKEVIFINKVLAY